ncbi:Putative small multi-drug export protein [Gracilibacillus ureilyticus]|uniref:Putative small multi-drug export protein n=1 Tax=Gracilibacillus ureilyticus TaxID=531814 RepID=A0A1H9RQL6_9BACI|nr:small multi-drug export protein [Gracilibacillus ureilyticus]SER74189.1 Putative small multi-drug export protein [Gracilibacillus ureilyticus]
MLDLVWAYVLVFVLSAVPFFEAIIITPVAIIAGIPAIPVFILAIVGNLLTVYLIILFIEKVRSWRKKKGDNGKRSGRAKQLWNKYGLPGLSLLGPFFVGSHLTAFLSLIFGGTKKRVTLWLTISVTGWSLVFGILAYFGIDWLNVDNQFLEGIFKQ